MCFKNHNLISHHLVSTTFEIQNSFLVINMYFLCTVENKSYNFNNWNVYVDLEHCKHTTAQQQRYPPTKLNEL